MGFQENLNVLLRGTSWSSDPSVAISAVPELAADTPPLVSLPTKEGEPERIVVPSLCVDEIVDVISSELPALFEKSKKKGAPTVFGADSDPKSDRVVQVLTQLIMQTNLPSINSHVVPALLMSHVTSKVISGQSASMDWLDKPKLKALETIGKGFQELDPTDVGRVLTNLGIQLAGRYSAAASLAAECGMDQRLGGLYRALLTNPLVMVFSRGTLEQGQGLGVAGRILGVRIQGTILDA